MESFTPSPKIDAIICDLIARINGFSDDFFDAYWLKLTEAEIEALTIKLLMFLAENLEGRILVQYLKEIRLEGNSD